MRVVRVVRVVRVLVLVELRKQFDNQKFPNKL